MKIVSVVDEILEIGQGKRGCSDDVVDVPFDEARQKTVIGFVDKLFLVANEEAGITWAKFTTHGDTRCLKIILIVE